MRFRLTVLVALFAIALSTATCDSFAPDEPFDAGPGADTTSAEGDGQATSNRQDAEELHDVQTAQEPQDAEDAQDDARDAQDGPDPQDGPDAEDTRDAQDVSEAQVADVATDGPTMADRSVDSVAPSPPSSVAPRLWLTADWGLDCAAGLVDRWTDASGHGDDASLQRGQIGPFCQIATHTINGIDVPYFAAPGAIAVDGTLDVDLSFLAGSAYTIFVVERRWVTVSYSAHANFLIGTDSPDQSHLSDCSNVDQALQIGYVYYSGFPQFVVDHTCDNLLATVSVTSDAPEPVSYDTLRFDPTVGRQIYLDGLQRASDNRQLPIAPAQGGAIGRAYSSTDSTDARFVGDIAEVIVYDAALVDTDRLAVEAYLRKHWMLDPPHGG